MKNEKTMIGREVEEPTGISGRDGSAVCSAFCFFDSGTQLARCAGGRFSRRKRITIVSCANPVACEKKNVPCSTTSSSPPPSSPPPNQPPPNEPPPNQPPPNQPPPNEPPPNEPPHPSVQTDTPARADVVRPIPGEAAPPPGLAAPRPLARWPPRPGTMMR